MPTDIEELIQSKKNKDEEKDVRKQNDYLIETVENLRDKLSFYESAKDIQPTKIKPSKEKHKHEATALSLLSDVHYEERIIKATTNGLNSYNPTIANYRIQKYFTNLLKLIENNRNDVAIDNLVLGLLGDNIHGYIHDEYLSTNYMTPIVASEAVLEQLISGIQFLLDNGKFKHIKVICKVGNHSRTTDKIYSMTELTNSYEYFIYRMLMRFFSKDSRIEIIAEESSSTYIEVYDKVIRFEHGHDFRYAGGIGGIYVPLVRHLLRQYKIKKFDLNCCGHWHSYESLSNALINGSICGYNSYSMRKGFDYFPPIQQFQLIDSKRGFTVNTKIFVD